MNNSVFISYRRLPAGMVARAVFQALRSREVDAFLDVESIDQGRFDSIIAAEIRSRPYFVIVLTPKTLDRCQEPGDWLLREIRSAMEAERKIIHLHTPAFDFADLNRFLDADLANEIANLNGIPLVHEYWEAAIERLHTRFLKPTDLAVEPVAGSVARQSQKTIARVAAGPPVTDDQMMAQKHSEQGWTLIDSDEAAAKTAFDQAIALDPEIVSAYAGRAAVHIAASDFQAAVDNFTDAIRLDPDDYTLYFGRSGGMIGLGKIDAAIADLERSIQMEPGNDGLRKLLEAVRGLPRPG